MFSQAQPAGASIFDPSLVLGAGSDLLERAKNLLRGIVPSPTGPPANRLDCGIAHASRVSAAMAILCALGMRLGSLETEMIDEGVLQILLSASLGAILGGYAAGRTVRLTKRLLRNFVVASSPKARSVLVTGGAGYVGSTLVPILLNRGYRVRVLDSLLYGGLPLIGAWANPAFELAHGDVRDDYAVREAVDGVDSVVHLAGIVGDLACARQPETTQAVNFEASLRLLEASRRAGVSRFVFASTCSNYGKMKDPDRLVDETSDLRPVSLYAETKVAVERALLDRAKTGQLCATPLRFATIFGVSPRMRFDLTVNEFTAELLVTKHLKVFGEQFWRPYVHVRDAARAIEMVLRAPAEKVGNRVFNVGSTNQNYRKQQLVDLISKLAPGGVVEYVHRDEDPRDYKVSFAKIKNELGFDVTRSVPEGIQEVRQLLMDGIIRDFTDPKYRN